MTRTGTTIVLAVQRKVTLDRESLLGPPLVAGSGREVSRRMSARKDSRTNICLRLCAALLAVWPAVGFGLARAEDGALPFFIGRDECTSCHVPGTSAGACTQWPISHHRRAYESLKRPVAREIALLSGLRTPGVENQVCLDCHATGADEGPRWWAPSFNVADGVQCEACHGPGSIHAEAYRKHGWTPDGGARSRVANQYRDREGAAGGREQGSVLAHDREHWSKVESQKSKIGKRAVSTFDLRPSTFDKNWSIRRGQRRQCATCHYDKPSHRMVLEEGFQRSPADDSYKTPINLAVAHDGSLLYVVCTHSNSLVVVDTKTQRVVDEVAVGKRPQDVAISPDGRRIFVTNRMSDSVSVIDSITRHVVSEVPVGDDPHGVLTDAAGRWIFVLNTSEDTVSVLDGEKLTEVRRLVAGRGPWSAALDPDGDSIVVTNVRPNPSRFRDPPQSEITVMDAKRGVVSRRLPALGTNMQQRVVYTTNGSVALFTMMRTKNLVPMTRLGQGWTITNGLGVVWPDGRVDQVLLDAPNDSFPDPIGIAVSPNGQRALVTSGGADEVAVVDVDALLETITATPDPKRTKVLPNHLGTSSRFVLKRIRVGHNPRAVVFASDGRRAYVANALDDSISVLDADSFRIVATIDLGGPDEVSELRHGERVFHSAGITFGRQFSCRSCHPDGHINGLTFDIEADGIGMQPVDNRSLRGIVDTGPFKWEGTNQTLSRQCGPRLAVFFTRLAPYEPDELAALVRYMCTIEQPPNRFRSPEGLTLAQRRGKAVFDRDTDNNGNPLASEERCAFCHSAGYKTDRQRVDTGTTQWFDAPADVDLANLFNADQYGELGNYYFIDAGTPTRTFDVAHLRNVCDSAPYLHNGSAATLEEIWTRYNMVNRHGMTGDVTRQQLNDLIAYLKTL